MLVPLHLLSHRFITAIAFSLIALLTSCSSVSTSGPSPLAKLNTSTYSSFDGDQFGYQKWLPKSEPTVVIVGLHGIAGASNDLRLLGEHLLDHFPGAAVYAPEIRGQGRDPIESRRGNIGDREEWFHDLTTFTRLVRQKHPRARIVWCGESMGSLIALHALAHMQNQTTTCDALILSSPIAKISREDLPAWKHTLLRLAALVLPNYRVSLEGLSGKEEVRVIKDVVHQDQVQTNDYHVSAFTLRLLSTLGDMIEEMPAQAREVSLPVLLLHGGHDVFSRPDDVEAFAKAFGEPAAVKRRFYPESYHLLFYDNDRERVLRDITTWLHSVRTAK